MTDAEVRGERIVVFDTTLRDGEQSPGATLTVDQAIVTERPPAAQRETLNNQYGYYQPNQPAAERVTPADVATDLASSRAQQIDEALDGGRHALVVAEEVDPPAAATLAEQKAIEQHFRVIRALVPLAE